MPTKENHPRLIKIKVNAVEIGGRIQLIDRNGRAIGPKKSRDDIEGELAERANDRWFTSRSVRCAIWKMAAAKAAFRLNARNRGRSMTEWERKADSLVGSQNIRMRHWKRPSETRGGGSFRYRTKTWESAAARMWQKLRYRRGTQAVGSWSKWDQWAETVSNRFNKRKAYYLEQANREDWHNPEDNSPADRDSAVQVRFDWERANA